MSKKMDEALKELREEARRHLKETLVINQEEAEALKELREEARRQGKLNDQEPDYKKSTYWPIMEGYTQEALDQMLTEYEGLNKFIESATKAITGAHMEEAWAALGKAQVQGVNPILSLLWQELHAAYLCGIFIGRKLEAEGVPVPKKPGNH